MAQMFGKRAIFLSSAIVMLFASLANMHVRGYAGFMALRILQAIGWGAFETLGLASVKELFFVSFN